MFITATAGKADAVEIFQNLNRQFTAHVQAVAEIGGDGRAFFAIERADQIGERHNAIVTVVAIFNDRRDKTLLRGEPQQLAHRLFFFARFARQIAHPPRLVAKQSLDFLPQRLLSLTETGFMARQMQPAFAARELPVTAHPLDQRQHQRLRLGRKRHATQPFAARAGLFAVRFMVAGERGEQFLLPARRERAA